MKVCTVTCYNSFKVQAISNCSINAVDTVYDIKRLHSLFHFFLVLDFNVIFQSVLLLKFLLKKIEITLF